jgi:hypothetical protein
VTDRAWTGDINFDAGNAGNWSPNGTPEPGDRLTVSIPGSTIDITHNVLQGDQLSFLTDATINLSRHAEVSLAVRPPGRLINVVANVAGRDSIDATIGGASIGAPPGRLTVNLATHANLSGNFNADAGAALTISGGENARYHYDATDTFHGASAVVDADVVGSGTFLAGIGFIGNSRIPSRLEFGGFVSEGQTVRLSGAPSIFAPFGSPSISTLVVDNSKQFHGTIDLGDFSLADLGGLVQADSWCYSNDMLSIRSSCGKVLDTLRVISDASSTGDVHGLSVSKTATGDILVSPGSEFHGLLTPSLT